jgi:hypothetical protein
MTKRFLIVQVFQDAKERRKQVLASSYLAVWNNLHFFVDRLGKTRSIIVHDITGSAKI